jgi:hypothetical protein
VGAIEKCINAKTNKGMRGEQKINIIIFIKLAVASVMNYL